MTINISDLDDATIYFEATDTLANRIDFAWSVYTHKTDYSEEEKEKAFYFLVYAFDISDVQDVNAELIELMAERDLYKSDNPAYIPGQQLTRLPFNPGHLLVTAQSDVDEIIEEAFDSAELLDMNPLAKGSDSGGGIIYLSEAERAKYRVHIHEGSFFQNGGYFDTTHMESHGKSGFGAFTLNVNGELSIFTHKDSIDGMAHSSMNAGAPVVAAGEIQIKKGVLMAVTTHSGHYFPTLFNVYRILEHFSLHNVDIRQAKVITFANPSDTLEAVSSNAVYYDYYQQEMYETSAAEVYHAMNKLIEKNVHKIQADINRYQQAGYYHSLLSLKDRVIFSDLTEKRSDLADAFLKATKAFQAEIPLGLSKAELSIKLQELGAIISDFQGQNEQLSFAHSKDKSNGRLAEKMQHFREQLQALKPNGEDDSIQSDIADKMKKIQ
ncbi:MAG: hypothetical protein P1U61_00670 [Legionellaceae bacterium]|nr:hypothetical protein [Legionellaceae bacterium]